MAWLSLPQATSQGSLSPETSPDGHGQRFQLHTEAFHCQSCSMTGDGEPLAVEAAGGLQWEKWGAESGPEALRPPSSPKTLQVFALLLQTSLFLSDPFF